MSRIADSCYLWTRYKVRDLLLIIVKNCLIVLVVLVSCLLVAVLLVLANSSGGPGGMSGTVAMWRYFDGQPDYEVTIQPHQIIIDEPGPQNTRYQREGDWEAHSFYCDSHLDTPSRIVAARELKNEDLEVDIGYFKPSSPGKIVCVKAMRGLLDRDPYPRTGEVTNVTYPPPKGLIRVGMLECDLQTLPWHAERVEGTPEVVYVQPQDTLSDGKVNKDFFGNGRNSDDGDQWQPMIYYYRSDRADAPELLVTVHHGRVVEVNGGAEETNDFPYQLPPRPPPAADEESQANRTWMGWLFDLIFTK